MKPTSNDTRKPGSLNRLVRHPAKFKIGDKVSVPARFGKTGTVKELGDGRYGVEFHNMPFTLWYDENELRPQTGQGFSWFRMPNDKGQQSSDTTMKPSPQQVTAFRDSLNRCMFMFEWGHLEKTVAALDALAAAVEEIDVKAKLAAVSKPAEPDSGQWQESK